MYRIQVVEGVNRGLAAKVQGEVVVGRLSSSDLVLADSKVSRRHAVFLMEGLDLVVKDEGSSYGTLLDGERVERGVLKHGDRVRVGDTVLGIVDEDEEEEEEAGTGERADDGAFSISPSDPHLLPYATMSILAEAGGPAPEMSVPAMQRRLDTVMGVAESLASIPSFGEALDRSLASLLDVFPQAERAFVMLGDAYEALQPRAVRFRGEETTKTPALSSTLCRAALEKKEVIVYRSEPDKSEWAARSLLTLNIWSALVIPLIVRDDTLGLLVVDTKDHLRPFGVADMQLAAAVGRQIAISMSNAALVEQVEREALTKQNLMRFLPAPVAEQALHGEVKIDLGGAACDCTALFADVVGFTSLSERMHPEGIVAMMNTFFDRMVPCIRDAGGAIDKFIGDCIMALWGIPFEEANHTLQAGRAGLAMQNALWMLNCERHQDGERPLAMGVGFEFGPVVAGNIGAESRMEYTVIGDTVNTAMRIESRACAEQVLAGPAAWERIQEHAYGYRMPPLSVKNKAAPLVTVSLRGIDAAAGEVLLHIPVRIGTAPALLVRRREHDVFEALHDRERTPEPGAGIDLDILEAEHAPAAHVVSVEAVEEGGACPRLGRSRLVLDDGALAGLLARPLSVTDRAWPDMPRGAPRRSPDVALGG